MSSRKSSKRTASQAVPQPEIIVVEETLTTVPLTQLAPVQAEPMLNESVIIREPAAASASTAAATIPAAAATTEEESTLHKAKKMATEASHQVQVAVTQGLEAAGVALKQASAATTDAFHTAQAKIADATAPTPTAATGPYNVKAGDLKPADTTSTLDKAKATLIHASEVIQEKAERAYDSLAAKSQSSGLTDGVKSASTSVAASVNAAVAQVSAAIQGNTGSEVVRDDVKMVDAKTQVSDASHSVEKHDGSLPLERNTDEFPHPRKHETVQQSKLLDAGLAPGHSGLGTDKVIDLPLGSEASKTSDATIGSTSSTTIHGEKKLVDTQPDLLTGPALSTQIGV